MEHNKFRGGFGTRLSKCKKWNSVRIDIYK